LVFFSSHEIDDSSDDNSYHEDDVPSLNADSIQQVFQRMVNMTSLDVINGQTYEENIQKTNTDSRDLSSTKTKSTIKKVKFVDELPGPSTGNKTQNQDLDSESGKVVTVGFKGGAGVSRNKNATADSDFLSNKAKDCLTELTRFRSKKQGRKRKGKRSTKCDEIKSVSKNEWTTVNRCAEVERELNTLIQYTAELLIRRWGEYLTMTTEQISVYEIENAKQHKMIEDVIDMLEDKDRYVWQLIDDLRFF
jgi:hypothetical protein